MKHEEVGSNVDRLPSPSVLFLNFAAMEHEEVEIVRLLQDAPPAHYILKMKGFKAFSEINKQQQDVYESKEFQVGGHNWKLLLYPTGKTKNKDINSSQRKKNKGMEYISMSVATADTLKSYVTVMLRLFVYNYAKDKYLTVQDWKTRQYHAMKTEHGFDKVLPLAEFLDPKSGYHVDDCCAFGAEVHVIESSRQVHCVESGVHRWRIDNFSKFKEEVLYSSAFPVGPCNWKIQLYPGGYLRGKGNSMSAFLRKCHDVEGLTVHAKFKIALHHQNGGLHKTYEDNASFDDQHVSWGTYKLISLAKLHDTSNGYLKKNTVIIEASVEAYSES